MEPGRPSLLSPGVPCLPGSSAAPGREPPLIAADFAPRPPHIPCAPLPADVAQQLAAGEPGLVAAWRKYSQLEALEEHRRAAAAAAAARQEQERREQAERPARSLGPAAPASGAASAALSGGSSGGSEGPASSGALHARSRASGVLQVQPGEANGGEEDMEEVEEEEEEREWAAAGDDGMGMAADEGWEAQLERELTAGDDGSLAEAAEGAAQQAAQQARRRPQQAPQQGPQQAAQQGPQQDAQQDAQQAQQAQQQNLVDEAIAAALASIGEPSWQAFSAKQLQQQQAAAAAAEAAGSARPRKGKERGAAAAANLADVLNKNSRAYHAGFAAAYKAARDELLKKSAKVQQKAALREHSKLVTRWSAISLREHAWFLQHQGKPLGPEEEKRMSLLQREVYQEGDAWSEHVLQQVRASGTPARYLHCSDRQRAQLDADFAARRARLEATLPRCYRLRTALPVPAASAVSVAPVPQLQHLGVLARQGQPPLFVPPAGGTSIPGDVYYLPCTVAAAAGGAGSSAAGAGGGGGGGAAYRKLAVPPLAEDPFVLQHAAAARQQGTGGAGGAAGGAAGAPADGQPLFCLAASAVEAVVRTPMLLRDPGWEIPVTILSAEEAAAAAAAAGGGEQAGGGDGGGVLVCLDKPLPLRQLKMRAKQQRLLKCGVLSLGVRQPQPAEQQQEQQQAGEPSPKRRRTRASAAAAAGAEDAPPAAATGAGGPAVPPREASYDCWQLGGCRLLVRSHGRMLLQQQAPSAGEGQQQQEQQGAAAATEQEQQGPRHVVLALRPEYLPEPDQEQLAMGDFCPWWLKLLLRPAADAVLVAYMHVPHARLMSVEALTASDVERRVGLGDGGAAWMAQQAGAGLGLLQQLLGALAQQPPGRYLLAHAPGDARCLLYRALPAEVEGELQGEQPVLPWSAAAANPAAVYDLHAAHERSGATAPYDPATDCVPPRWRPFHPDFPQVPNTFPPKLPQIRAKRRGKANLPYAWGVLGEGGDFDQVAHVATISKADYLAGLEEELQ